MQVKEGYYQHYKGNVYLVIGIAKHSETLEDMVVYKCQHDTIHFPDVLWVRPASMFVEFLEVDGKIVQRFRPITAVEAQEIIVVNRFK